MNRRSRIISAVLLAIWSLLLLTNTSQASVSADELQKIEAAAPAKARANPAKPRKLLVFNLCNGFKHSSIPYLDKALEIIGCKSGAYEAVISSDMSQFAMENLKQFDAVCFNNTTQLKFDEPLRKSLMDFVKGGKGIIGIHAAMDTFYKWPEAAEMMGGQFSGHPWGDSGTWAIKIDEPNHPLTAAFKGKGFKVKDEIYRTKESVYLREKQLVLMSLDMTDPDTRKPAEQPSDMDTGISWVRSYGKGRIFYCSLGHNPHIAWDPAILQHYLDGIQFALGDLSVDTKPKPVVSSRKGSEMEELMEKVKTYNWGQNREALTEVSGRARKAYGKPKELKQIEESFLAVLKSPDATQAGKQFVCGELSIIGTECSVPTLAKMLTVEETSDMARYALERIGGSAVDEALREALPKAKGKPRVGIINSLGQRKDSKAVGAISSLIYDSDETVATAATAALGHIADDEATKALAQAKDKTTGKVLLAVLDSYLKCADKLAAEGKKEQALAIYKGLYKPDEPTPIRTAALRGIVTVTKEDEK